MCYIEDSKYNYKEKYNEDIGNSTRKKLNEISDQKI